MELEKFIQEATLEVFATMVFMDIEAGAPLVNSTETIESNISSLIGLAGDVRGILAVKCPASVATGITGAMLGMDIAEIDEDVKDAMGEIANMIAGGLKVALAPFEKNIELAIPTTVVGESLRTSGLAGADQFLIPFTTPAGQFGVELKYVLS